ncbi:hypothetical protein [Hymenobacter swuensis]|uniref:Transposase n=1 Tax=Hymenobacter swuensis DY53 TaxID=1227739 RepID=W8F1A2_9BACT|nr:hypothetical protein [Hymenobacter swuensis]AHJ95595.1 hypothetical protein Hsw_PA0262 [Hymenobacter swuensis DY53]
MTEKPNPGGTLATRKKYTPAFKAECVRQVAGEMPCSAERDEIKHLCAELKRVEMERDMLKKVVTIFAQPPQS